MLAAQQTVILSLFDPVDRRIDGFFHRDIRRAVTDAERIEDRGNPGGG